MYIYHRSPFERTSTAASMYNVKPNTEFIANCYFFSLTKYILHFSPTLPNTKEGVAKIELTNPIRQVEIERKILQ